MILYFSATGNSKHVAQRIADNFNDSIQSIEDLIKNNIYEIELEKDEKLGIVSPTYNWQLPIIVTDYFSKLKIISNDNYIYFIATYGTTSGRAGTMINELLNNKINSFYDVKMPDTWTVLFDLSDKEKVKKILEKSDIQIDKIIEKIKAETFGDFTKFKTPKAVIGISKKIYENVRRTRHLNVDDKCIGCGLCARNCPINAIRMENGKPMWIKEKCIMCLRCLHNCPKFAINYDNKTGKHGQYTFEKYNNK